jgi:hypothetical protein
VYKFFAYILSGQYERLCNRVVWYHDGCLRYFDASPTCTISLHFFFYQSRCLSIQLSTRSNFEYQHSRNPAVTVTLTSCQPKLSSDIHITNDNTNSPGTMVNANEYFARGLKALNAVDSTTAPGYSEYEIEYANEDIEAWTQACINQDFYSFNDLPLELKDARSAWAAADQQTSLLEEAEAAHFQTIDQAKLRRAREIDTHFVNGLTWVQVMVKEEAARQSQAAGWDGEELFLMFVHECVLLDKFMKGLKGKGE